VSLQHSGCGGRLLQVETVVLQSAKRHGKMGIVRLALVRAYGGVSGMSTTSNPYRGFRYPAETIREWSLRFGRTFAKSHRRRRPQPGDKWFLDEVFVRIRGKLHYLWRAVDQHGNVLDVLVQSRRNKTAAKRFFRKLLKGLCYLTRVIVTDKLGSYGPALPKPGTLVREGLWCSCLERRPDVRRCSHRAA
jgi:transposase-like protein